MREDKHLKRHEEFCPNRLKAQKYDSLMAANSEVVQNNIQLTETYQENKQLKEIIEKPTVRSFCKCGWLLFRRLTRIVSK